MTLDDLKTEIQKYQYIEDTNIIDVALASIIATRLSLGDPIWLVLIGASSGGKSQILRPLSLTDPKFLHRLDDLTENTLLSAMASKDGETSLLLRIGGKGIIVMSDLTVLFSKSAEARQAILSQFRMIYDGEMTKVSGNKGKPTVWKGELGILAGSTPSIYRHFEEVADMGERFIYYRMKDYDAKKATKLALGRGLYGKKLDDILGALYAGYIKETVENAKLDIPMNEVVEERILEVASLAERIRTPTAMDWRAEKITRVPIPAMPMRVALQLRAVARGLAIMRGRELDENDLNIIDWCALSLANEEKRACLKILCSLGEGLYMTSSSIADRVGLDTTVIRTVLQNLAAVGVLERTGSGEGLQWRIRDEGDKAVLRRINGTQGDLGLTSRAATGEEGDEKSEAADYALENFGKE